MGNSLLAWTNAVKTATLTATSAEPTLPVTNLANDQGSSASAWQTLTGVLSATLTVTPAARTTFRACGVFRTNMSATGTVTFRAFTNPGPVQVATTAAITVTNGQAVGIFTSDTAADYVTMIFSDASNPDNHLNIPLAFAGPAWQPLTAMSWTSTMGRAGVSDTVTTRGGQVYVDLRATSRHWEIALDGVRSSEAFTQLDVLERASFAGGNVLLAPNITSSDLQSEATFGTLTPTADVSFPLGVGARRSWRGHLAERL